MSQQVKNNTVQIVETLQEGKVPSTQMIQNEVEPAKQFLAEKEKETPSVEKEKAFHETRKFLEAFEQLLVDKNVADRMSRLVEAAKRVSEHTEPNVPTSTLWRETRQFAVALNELIPGLIKSKQFRQSILDLFKVMRDILNMKEREHRGEEKLENAFVEGKPVSSTAQMVANEAKQVGEEIRSGDIPEEQKSRIREDLKRLLGQLKNSPSTSKAFQKFLVLWDILNTELTMQLNREKVDPDIREVEDAARDLIEAFAGRKIDSFINKLQKANETIQNDLELQQYLQTFRNYLRSGLEHPEVLETEQFINEGDELVQKGRRLADKYYNDPTLNDLSDEAQELLDAIKTDDLVQNLKYRADKVADAFTYTDITGSKHLDTDLISQMRADLVPFLLEHIKELPLPGLNVHNEDFEYLEINELKVNLEDIVPEKIHIQASNDTDITPKNFEAQTQSETVIKFKMEGIRPTFQNFQFRFKRRGLINLEDEGRANLHITGHGITVNIEFDVEIDDKKRTYLSTHRVNVHVDHIYVHVIESEHKTLLNMVTGLFAPMLKLELQKALRQRIEDIGNDWAKIINKRILSAIPSVGSTVESLAKNVPILGETIKEKLSGDNQNNNSQSLEHQKDSANSKSFGSDQSLNAPLQHEDKSGPVLGIPQPVILEKTAIDQIQKPPVKHVP